MASEVRQSNGPIGVISLLILESTGPLGSFQRQTQKSVHSLPGRYRPASSDICLSLFSTLQLSRTFFQVSAKLRKEEIQVTWALDRAMMIPASPPSKQSTPVPTIM